MTGWAVETIAYSTTWNGGGTVTVAVDGVAIKEANAQASGDVVWNGGNASVSIGKKGKAKVAVMIK